MTFDLSNDNVLDDFVTNLLHEFNKKADRIISVMDGALVQVADDFVEVANNIGKQKQVWVGGALVWR